MILIYQQFQRRLLQCFFIPKVTNKHQPSDMGMIASLKIGYRIDMLDKLLENFDADGGYEDAARRRAGVTPECAGLVYGGQERLLDAMEILLAIWEGNNKYERNDSILRCWRKADIFPVTWNADINNDVGSCTMPMKKKQLAEEDSNKLCDLFDRIQLRVDNDNDN